MVSQDSLFVGLFDSAGTFFLKLPEFPACTNNKHCKRWAGAQHLKHLKTGWLWAGAEYRK